MMTDIEKLLSAISEDNIKKSAGIGAGVGALLGAKNGNLINNAVVGAGLGAALAWAMDQFKEEAVTQSKDSESVIRPESEDK